MIMTMIVGDRLYMPIVSLEGIIGGDCFFILIYYYYFVIFVFSLVLLAFITPVNEVKLRISSLCFAV